MSFVHLQLIEASRGELGRASRWSLFNLASDTVIGLASEADQPRIGMTYNGPLRTPGAALQQIYTHAFPPTVVVVQDHIAFPNLTGMNPLLGPPVGPNYPRFLPLSTAYSATLRRLAFLAAHKLGLGLNALAEGVYAWVSGPTYETPAEGRMLRNAGADVVGMSTIPEVVAGKEEGLEVLVLSLVTNMVVIPDKYRSIREEVEAEVSEFRDRSGADAVH